MAFTFYLDNQLTDSPINDMTLATTIKRDSALGAIFTKQEVKLEYNANLNVGLNEISGYAYLKSLWEQGLCSECSISIYDKYSDTESLLHFQGVIKIADLEFDEQRLIVSAEVTDNSYSAYVENNKQVKAALTSDRTKSKEPITPPSLYDVTCFNGETGVYFADVKMYRIYDVFKFLIPAITDNKVTFESSYLTSSDSELFLTRGNCLIDHGSEPDEVIQLSFQELFDEVKKLPVNSDVLEPIGFFIDTTDPLNPVLRLENESYFFNGNTVLTFSDIKELKTYAKIDKLYSSVKVGSTATIDGAAPEYTMVESTQYFGFKEEDYVVYGQCNIDTQLNLVNNFVISNNAINSAFVGGVTDFEGDLFIIECDSVNPYSLTADAKGYEFFGVSPPYYYNIGLNNAAKLGLYSNSIQSNIGNFLGIGSDGFRAAMQTDKTFTTNPNQPGGSTFVPPQGQLGLFDVPLPIFPDDATGSNYDGNNNYDTATGFYTCPLDGNFSFASNIRFTAQGLQSNIRLRVELRIFHYDSTGTIIKSQSGSVHDSLANGNFSLNVAHAINAVNGDLVGAFIGLRFYTSSGQFPPIPYYQAVTFQSISFFECNGTPDGSVVLAANTSDNYRILQHEFKANLPVLTWQQIVQNPTGMFPFEKDGVTRFGWIEEIRRNDQTGESTIKLTSSNATTP